MKLILLLTASLQLCNPGAETFLLNDLRQYRDETGDVADVDDARIPNGRNERLTTPQDQLRNTTGIEVLKEFPAAVDPQTKPGWEVLFDGKNLEKWRSATKDTLPSSGWMIRSGELTVLKGRSGGDIITRDTYSSFELTLDFKLTESANSGVKYLVNEIENSQTKKSSFMGIEYQIIDDLNYPEIKDSPDGESSTGSAYLLYPPKNKTLKPPGQWNQVRILVRGTHVEHWLNGKKIVSFERNSPDFRQRVAKTKFKDYPAYALADSGRILLQDHGDEVTFRNILIRRLEQ